MGDDSRFQVVRPLGSGKSGVIARDVSVNPPRLVIVERIAAPPEERARLLRRGRALAALEHPKVVRVREALESGGEAVFVSDFVDGEWLSAVVAHSPRPPVEALLRVCVDVLEGLAALHDLRDDRGQPMNFVHGSVSPESVLVAEDGVGELARTCTPGTGAKDKYVAPELRRGERPTDLRSDVYSAGAILRDVLAAAPATAKWAEQLTDVAFRATSVDPQNRWPSAAAMATAVRRIAGAKLATAHDVATSLRDAYGSRMRARRTALDMLEEGTPPSSEEPISIRGSELIVIDSPSQPTLVQERAPTVKTLPPPMPARANVARVALVKKAVNQLEVTDDEDEPATSRFPGGNTTQKGIQALAPPFPPVASPFEPSPSAAPPPVEQPKKKPSLPPPDIVPPASLPPPDIQPIAESALAASPSDSDAYRRKLPTFPTQIVVKQRRSLAVPVMGIAAAMVITFGVGWWLGHNHPPPGEGAQEQTPSVPVVTMAPAPTAPPSAAPATATPAASSVATPAPPSATTAPAASSAPPVAVTPPPSTVAVAPQPPRPTAPTVVVAPPPTPKPTAPPAPTVTAEPKPTATAKPAEPGPGYTPNEL
ncbi:MAG TPA: protein kinase [Polyangiaceae bacterium]